MKKIITILSLLVIVVSYGQKCKYEKNEIDEFTKKEVIITKEQQLTKVGMGMGNFLRFDVRSLDGNKFIRLFIFSNKAFSVRQGSEVMFLLENDQVATLHYTESVVADFKRVQQLNHTQWTVHVLLHIDQESLEALLDIPVKKVRWYTSEGYHEEDVNPKHKYHLSNALKCL